MVDRRALVVAQRAAELANATGAVLPDDLALWRLAGGRPRAAHRPGDPEELGELLEQVTAPSQRRREGAHFTPRGLARELVGRALAGHDRPTVGDPACGGGAMLLAAARHLVTRGEDPAEVVDRLWGQDLDPVAAATTEAALALWAGRPPARGRCATGDALAERPTWPLLDVIVGNPPFLSPLSGSTGRSSAATAELRGRFGAVVRPYTDAAALFLLAACDLVRPGGTVALIQPLSVLTNRDAAAVRAAVERVASIRHVWQPPSRAFAAAVDVCVPILDVCEASRPHADAHASQTSWAGHLTGVLGVPAVELSGGTVLGDVAEVAAPFRSEYYGTVPHVHEEHDCPAGRPLVTTGLVDLGGVAWGERPVRVGGRRWERPVVDVAALEGRAATWLERTAGPKVLVATQTKVVEVAVDDDGRYVASVPLVVVRPDPAQRWEVAAALASPAVSAWLFQRSAGSGLSRGALRPTAPLLRAVPLPVDGDAWAAGTAAFAARDLHTFADAMGGAYCVGDEVRAWWMPLARSVWSLAPALR